MNGGHVEAPRAPRSLWVLAGTLGVALGLRLWAITFGLPYLEHPDEPFWIFAVLKMVKTGDPNPHDFIYPSLYYYINALIYLVYYAVGRVLGAFQSLADLAEPVLLIGGSGKLALRGLLLGGRFFSVAAGCGTVALTFFIARRLTGRLSAATFAALLAAVSPILVTHDRFMAPDGPMTFFTTLTVAGAWLIYERGRWRDYVLSGVALGLAVGMKYNTAPFALAIVLAHFLRKGRWGLRDWRWVAAGAISVLTFLLTTPYALFDTQTFLDGALIDVRHYTGGHAGVTGGSLAWYVTYFWQTDGPVLALAAAGALWGIYRRQRGVIMVAATALAYLLFIGAFTVHFERTAVPLAPLLALLAAALVAALTPTGEHPWTHTAPPVGLSRLPAQGDSGARRTQWAAVAALVVVTLAVPLVGTVREALRLTTPDGLDIARTWIDANLPPGARIGVESYSPWIDPQKFSIQGFYKLNDHPPEWYVAEGYDYLVFSQRMFRRFYADPVNTAAALAQYEALFSAFEPVMVFTDGGYEVRVHRIGGLRTED